MTTKIGTGEVVDGFYEGTNPFDDGEDVCLVRTSDLVGMCNHTEKILLATAKQMPRELYDYSQDRPNLINEMIYTANDLTQHKLFLDRRMFGTNLKDIIWIRYVSVDQEEAEVQPDGN